MKLDKLPDNPLDKHKTILPAGTCPLLPILGMFCGRRGQGKSTACTRLVRWYVNRKLLNSVYVISPTALSQSDLWKYGKIPSDNIYQVNSGSEVRAAISKILEEVEQLKIQYDQYESYKDAYTRLMRKEYVSTEQLSLLENNSYLPPGPPVDWPAPGIILDDLSHFDKVLPSTYFTSLCLRHRHLCGGVGISLFILVQNLKSGLPRAIRQNLSLIVLYGTHDKTNLLDLYYECSHLLNKERFIEVFTDATSKPHSFLAIDLSQTDPAYVFSQDFQKFYSIENNSDSSVINEYEKNSEADKSVLKG